MRSYRDFPLWLSQLRSLALLTVLRIQHCHELLCRLQTQLRSGVAVTVVEASSCSSNVTPSLGTSICQRCSPKKQKITIYYMISYCTAQGTISNLLGWNTVETSMRKIMCIYLHMYDWVMMLYCRN